MQDPRKLRVWRQAHDLAVSARRACNEFPRTGFGSLKNQLTRAAESVVLNIVEGCGSSSIREFARFLEMSIKSTMELEEQLELAKDHSVMRPYTYTTLNNETISIRRQLSALRARVLAAKPLPNVSDPESSLETAGNPEPGSIVPDRGLSRNYPKPVGLR